MQSQCIPQHFLSQAEIRPDKPAYARVVNGQWEQVNWRCYVEETLKVSAAFSRLGLDEGDKVCILSFNRPEWSISAMAALLTKVVPIGIYTTCSAPEIQHIINHSQSKVIIIENQAYWQSIHKIVAQCPSLEHVIVIEDIEHEHDFVINWSELCQGLAEDYRAQIQEKALTIKDNDLATLIYTSGTTGPTKGVMLSHGNIRWMAQTLAEICKGSEKDVLLSYLPLCHIAEQMLTLHTAACVGFCVYYAESMDKVPENIVSVQPSIFFGVPRIWEKYYEGIRGKLAGAKGFKVLLLSLANKVAKRVNHAKLSGKMRPWHLLLPYWLFDRLLFKKLKAKLGLGNARIFTSGGAPLSTSVLEWFTEFDIIIQEIYGQSEVAGATTFNQPKATRFGSVGKALPGLEIKLAEDGEICVKGPSVFSGYYNDPETSKAALRADAWLHSGDIGKFDEDGYLYITGRKKDIIITAGGKNITPQNIEEELCQLEYIMQAVVIGDRRKYLSALLTVDMRAAQELASTLGINSNNILNSANFLDQVQRDIDRINERFARVEHIRKFHLLEHDFSIEAGELTPTLKIKRDVVANKYQQVIDNMYED